MLKKFTKFLPRFDWVLLLATLFLVILGLSVIYATSLDITGFTRFDKQLVFVGLGLIVMFTFAMMDYRRLGSSAIPIYGLCIFLLVAVLMFGTNIRGTTGWFLIGPFSIQPVEFVKVLIVLVLAYYFSRVSRPDWTTWLKSLVIITPIIILLYFQPDFGPIFILLLVWLILNALRGLKKRGWLILLVGGLLVATIGWSFILSDHQKGRITTFFNPSADPTGKGFHVQQSIIAVGSGQLTGQGLGSGLQSQLQFLPEAATDFVFASLLEQLGFIGFLILMAVWVGFFWRLILLITNAKDNFTLYVTVGFSLLIFIQAAVNIMMNIGLAPIVGLPLPFVSYGGSSLIAGMMLLGILQSIAMREKI